MKLRICIDTKDFPGSKSITDIFDPNDDLHVNKIGAYAVAYTWYSVLYGKSLVGLPPRNAEAGAWNY